MGHWLLIYTYVDKGKKSLLTYFIDSFALPVTAYDEHLEIFLSSLRKICAGKGFYFKFQSLDKPIQHAQSLVCGGYACYFALQLFNKFHKKLDEIVYSTFNPRRALHNDRIIKRFIRTFWPVKGCCNINWKQSPAFCPIMTYNDAKCILPCRCKNETHSS